MKKIAWLSRHLMHTAQAVDLAKTLNCEHDDLVIEAINHTWAASADATADATANAATWGELTDRFDVVCGVFPQVALEAMGGEVPVYTSINAARPDLRVDEGPIPFAHVRWSRVLPAPHLLRVLEKVTGMGDYNSASTAEYYIEKMKGTET